MSESFEMKTIMNILTHRISAPRPRERGFTLLEVLVALLVLAIGLLGLAMLQTTGLKFNTDSYTRTQATFFAYDIIDKIRANPTGRSAGNYDIANNAAAVTAMTNYSGCKASTCNCDGGTNCSAANLAIYDLGKWYEMQNTLLPGIDTVDRSTIIRVGNTITVTLRWKEQGVPLTQKWEVEL